MKKRHIKTISERFGFDHNIKNRGELCSFLANFISDVIKPYLDSIRKNGNGFDVEEFLQSTNTFHDGIFYLEALGRYDKNNTRITGRFTEDGKWVGYVDCCDAYDFQNDDEFCKRVKLHSNYKKGDKEYMEYVKYYVIKSSVDGWSLVMFNYPKDTGYDFVITKHDVLVEGNIGTYIS